MNRNDYLERAKTLISEDRNNEYGDAKVCHERIAQGWSILLGKPITPVQVILCMDWVKSVRLIDNPTHDDSWADKIGYSALGGEIATS